MVSKWMCLHTPFYGMAREIREMYVCTVSRVRSLGKFPFVNQLNPPMFKLSLHTVAYIRYKTSGE